MTPAQRREAVAHLEMAHDISERRAGRTIGVDRMSVRYRRTEPDDTGLRAWIEALAQSVGALATAVSVSCCAVRAGR